jgi:hypothetical protein
MRFLGIMALAAILGGLLGDPALAATKHKRTHLAHPKPQAQRQIICSTIIHGCREVKEGCHTKLATAERTDVGSAPIEVCP